MEPSRLRPALGLLAAVAALLATGIAFASAEAAARGRTVVLQPATTHRATVQFRLAPRFRRARRATAVLGHLRRPIRRPRFLRAVRRGVLTLHPRRGLRSRRGGRHWVLAVRTASARRVLMAARFRGTHAPNGLITNEYAGWHEWDRSAARSPVWRSDGGSLFSVPGTDASGQTGRLGYTGTLDSDFADKYSEQHTHSNKMRFWTRQGGFENVRIDADLKPVGWDADAPSNWAGFKFYLRRQRDATESAFYTVEPDIRDGHVYIQKKCLGNTGGGNYAADGTYYILAQKSGHPVALGAWQHVAGSSRTNGDGSVTISLYRDGALAAQATDHGVRSDGTGCPPLGPGHVGFRSDYLQYYLDDWTVTALP
jgi:hypothetical protein